MTFQVLSAYILGGLLAFTALLTWIILLTGKFKPSYIIPCKTDNCRKLAKRLFLIQSLILVFGSGLVFMRIGQLIEMHNDNVIDNLIYGLSSLLLIRAIGDFRFFGFFRSEDEGVFTQLDRRIFTPLAFVLFVLSLMLVI